MSVAAKRSVEAREALVDELARALGKTWIGPSTDVLRYAAEGMLAEDEGLGRAARTLCSWRKAMGRDRWALVRVALGEEAELAAQPLDVAIGMLGSNVVGHAVRECCKRALGESEAIDLLDIAGAGEDAVTVADVRDWLEWAIDEDGHVNPFRVEGWEESPTGATLADSLEGYLNDDRDQTMRDELEREAYWSITKDVERTLRRAAEELGLGDVADLIAFDGNAQQALEEDYLWDLAPTRLCYAGRLGREVRADLVLTGEMPGGSCFDWYLGDLGASQAARAGVAEALAAVPGPDARVVICAKATIFEWLGLLASQQEDKEVILECRGASSYAYRPSTGEGWPLPALTGAVPIPGGALGAVAVDPRPWEVMAMEGRDMVPAWCGRSLGSSLGLGEEVWDGARASAREDELDAERHAREDRVRAEALVSAAAALAAPSAHMMERAAIMDHAETRGER
ncbi:MAG: hypothetical protein IJH08_04570 [Atopobiaceae bacterium]|nr:hypothetical protein [Atopobiaceae bacterium]